MTNPYAPPRAIVSDIRAPLGHLEPADRMTRLGASILDGLIFMGMVYAPFLIGAFVSGAAAAPDSDASALALGAVLIGCLGFAVWVWLTVRYMRSNGQSIAKRIVGIKVVRADGAPISVGRLIWLRNVLNWFISIVPLYGILDVLFIFGESRQCLHDRIADTIVIKA
jgi:uncharacterized RDD family membrane protein YckC